MKIQKIRSELSFLVFPQDLGFFYPNLENEVFPGDLGFSWVFYLCFTFFNSGDTESGDMHSCIHFGTPGLFVLKTGFHSADGVRKPCHIRRWFIDSGSGSVDSSSAKVTA